MVSLLLNASLGTTTSNSAAILPQIERKFASVVSFRRTTEIGEESSSSTAAAAAAATLFRNMARASVVPVAVSLSVVLWCNPVHAGFLSGFSGIESTPGPQLPQIDFLTRLNEENQKKYAENDARFKESPILKQLLERTKLNKDKNKKELLDKYCIRGAEWGVGDCSAEGMTPDEREKFITMLKQKAGVD